jgi:serine/threonine protein kinase
MMNCPQCQQEISGNERFCGSCGYALRDATQTPTESQPTIDTVVPAPPSDPLLGQTLDAKYELVARLGEGGMGTVYRARRVHIGDEVAVKVLLPQYVSNSGSVERFRREARAAAMLRHPNVVTIHDFGEPRGADAPAYIVMELVEGRSLKSILRAEGRLAPQRTVDLMHGICAGVSAAHRRNIVHRDLKPDNIIVLPPDREGERESVKVIDFGIAKLRDATDMGVTLTQAGTVLGTPFYMSPEQCRGESLDARADVYSLGAILYEMLSGAPPFTGTTITSVVAKHLTEQPPKLASNLNVAPALEAVCMRALVKNADARYQTVEAFYQALAGALTMNDTSATMPRQQAAYAGQGAPTSARRTAQTTGANASAASSPAAPTILTQDAVGHAQYGALQPAATDAALAHNYEAGSAAPRGLRPLRNYALIGAVVAFVLSIGAGLLARTLGWTTQPYAYDDFVIELLTEAMRDALFGACVALVIYEWRRAPAPWGIMSERRIASLIVYGATGVTVLMAPFVLLRTSLLVLPLTLAAVGFGLGLLIYGARVAARKVGPRS